VCHAVSSSCSRASVSRMMRAQSDACSLSAAQGKSTLRPDIAAPAHHSPPLRAVSKEEPIHLTGSPSPPARILTKSASQVGSLLHWLCRQAPQAAGMCRASWDEMVAKHINDLTDANTVYCA
jgi:hypothetical protein